MGSGPLSSELGGEKTGNSSLVVSIVSFNGRVVVKKKWKDLSNGDSTGIPVDCFSLVQIQDAPPPW